MIDLLERPSTSSGHSPVVLAAPTLAGLNDFLFSLAIYASVFVPGGYLRFRELTGGGMIEYTALEHTFAPGRYAPAHRGVGHYLWREGG